MRRILPYQTVSLKHLRPSKCAKGITLENITMPNAGETLWSCEDISLKNITAKGDYFGMNSTNIKIDGFQLAGNYCFDGGKISKSIMQECCQRMLSGTVRM